MAKVSPPKFHRIGPNEHWELIKGITCIELTKGKIALINTVDYPKVAPYRWQAQRGRYTYYAIAGGAVEGGGQTAVMMHRIILDAPPEMFVDHINGDGLDNSSISGRLNIRLVTPRGNQQNRHYQISRFGTGVYQHGEKFSSMIQDNGKRINLGHFRTIEEASNAYWQMNKKLSEQRSQ